MESLREAVLGALELHAGSTLPELRFPEGRPLVVASGNALSTGRLLFDDRPAVFASESVVEAELQRGGVFDFGVVISASGGKHAPQAVRTLAARGLDVFLLTCSPDSAAAGLVPAERLTVTPSRSEPITYNTSTYLGMVLAKTGEDPVAIRDHLRDEVEPGLSALSRYKAFYLLVPSRFDAVREMLLVKFDELFGGRVNGRCYTFEQTLHAKTVVPWDEELFVSFGEQNELFGEERLHVPLPEGAGYGAMIATGYYVVGRLQEALEPWFMENAERYARQQAEWFRRLG